MDVQNLVTPITIYLIKDFSNLWFFFFLNLILFFHHIKKIRYTLVISACVSGHLFALFLLKTDYFK